MLIPFEKYHALRNDFLVVDRGQTRIPEMKLGRIAQAICDRKSGVGADGVIYLSSSPVADRRFEIYNADGSWAEKSGNGLRIAGLHEYLLNKPRRAYTFQTAVSTDTVSMVKRTRDGYYMKAQLGCPTFETRQIPVKTRQKFMIQAPLKVAGVAFPVTCLSVGNPHTVLIVSDFDFDWKTLGREIETHKVFPHRTNVEFVRVVNRRKIEVADWERGAGATGSSGTGAAASVCTTVLMGLTERKCEVVFATGSLHVHWNESTGIIELTGPVVPVSSGSFLSS